jgi:hypothetical protein
MRSIRGERRNRTTPRPRSRSPTARRRWISPASPTIDVQDFDIKHFDVAIKNTAPGKVTATVTFDNFGKQETIVLDLIAIKNDWRIYDITWARDAEPKTLRGLFRLTRQGD